MCNLEAVPLSGGAVEEKFVIAHRLAGPEGTDVAVIAPNLDRNQAATGFEMALHTDFQLPIPAKTRRIDDRLPYLFPRGIGCKSYAHVCGPRAMTPLAVNPFRNWVWEKRKAGIAALWITALLRQTVVAE